MPEAAALAACVLALGALAALGACSGDAGEPAASAALSDAEQLGFVPMGSSDAAPGDQIAIFEPLLVGMYEVTRGEFRRFVDEASVELDPLLEARLHAWPSAADSLPMSYVTREEAAAYARWAGMRLPTRREWLFCAMSTRSLAYPWSDSWQQGRANTLDLGLAPLSPTPVGTFEGGRTATHLYDMLGNVWEWIADEPGASTAATALGGSYFRYRREIHREGVYFADEPSPGSRFEDLGFRVCAPARAWLESHAAALGSSSNARARLVAVGRRWGSAAEALLADLASSARDASARSALEALLAGARG